MTMSAKLMNHEWLYPLQLFNCTGAIEFQNRLNEATEMEYKLHSWQTVATATGVSILCVFELLPPVVAYTAQPEDEKTKVLPLKHKRGGA